MDEAPQTTVSYPLIEWIKSHQRDVAVVVAALAIIFGGFYGFTTINSLKARLDSLEQGTSPIIIVKDASGAEKPVPAWQIVGETIKRVQQLGQEATVTPVPGPTPTPPAK